MRHLAAGLLLALAVALPQDTPGADPPPKPDYSRGQKLLDGYFKAQVKDIADRCLADVTTKEDWEKRRPELRRQFLDMMGLWPMPPKTDLKATVTGTFETEAFTVEKLHFQSMPGLYVTANLYLPKTAGMNPAARLPVILYVCGHGNVVEGGTSFGSKAHYQYHPAWFASHGYACLILDTLQLAEIQGLHHGTHREKMWWWHARGYTPAGVELWNAIRALDYLETRPEVDMKRVGVTGRSGGGAYSWWLPAADDRPQAVVPVAGIADLYSHVCEGTIEQFKTGIISGHCDCMYMVNTYRWDFAAVAALCAPRPLLLGNSDADGIFPVPGYRRLAEKVRKVYALYGAEEKFQLHETKGPHKDTPELHLGINKWMNRWLKGDTTSEVKPDLEKRLKPQQLRVFDKLPEPRINEKIHETFVPTADVPNDPAAAKEWLAKNRDGLMTALKTKVFGGWPTNPPPLGAKVAADVTDDGVRLRAIDFTSEAGVELRMWVLTNQKVGKPDRVFLKVLDDIRWEGWCHTLGPAFADALQLAHKPKRDDALFAQHRWSMEAFKFAFVGVAPRGIGPTRWAESGSRDDVHVRRRFPLIGQTLDGQRVWDVRRGVGVVRSLPDMKGSPLTLTGAGESAGIALYAGLFEPSVGSLELSDLPPSHRDGPFFLNVLKYVDTPQAVALMAPRPVTLRVNAAERAAWEWPLRVVGDRSLTVKVVGE